MTPVAAAAPYTTLHTTTQYTIQVAFLRKDPRLKIKNNYTMSMGEHRNEILVVKIIFILYINGGAQEGKHDFIKIFFNGGNTGMKI